MRCALVFHLVATIFVVVYCAPEPCVYDDDFEEKRALCGIDDVSYIFEFIPPISQNITYIDLYGQPLKQLPFNAFRNLSSQSSVTWILLRQCKISHVDAGALLNLPNLTSINLSHNDIRQIDKKLFSDTKQLKYIYMDYNKIEVVPSGLFQNLLQLEVVNLQYNQIRLVEWNSFKNTPSLRIIDLDNNQIEFMDMLFKDTFDNLTNLWLNDNPWKCDCKLGPLHEFLIKIHNLNQIGLVCENPPTLHGQEWGDISRETFVCPSEDPTSTLDSVMSSTEPMTTTEAADNVPVTVYSGTTLPTIVKRRSYRRNMDSELPMRIIRSSAESEIGVSVSNMADVDEE